MIDQRDPGAVSMAPEVVSLSLPNSLSLSLLVNLAVNDLG